MGGFFLDIFALYLLRVLIRSWKRLRSAGWAVQKGTIDDISCPLTMWGCPVAEIVYLYKINDRMYSGSESIPFIWHSSAEDFVRTHPRGSILGVRAKPSDPEISILM